MKKTCFFLSLFTLSVTQHFGGYYPAWPPFAIQPPIYPYQANKQQPIVYKRCEPPYGEVCVDWEKCKSYDALRKLDLRDRYSTIMRDYYQFRCEVAAYEWPKVCCFYDHLNLTRNQLSYFLPAPIILISTTTTSTTTTTRTRTAATMTTTSTTTATIPFYSLKKIEKFTKHRNFDSLPHNSCGLIEEPPDVDRRAPSGEKEYGIVQEFPWMAFLYGYYNSVKTYLDRACAGTIISDRHVLTAAHCVKDFGRRGKSIIVRVGGRNDAWHCGDSFCAVRTYEAEKVSKYIEYRTDDLRHDIAVVRLNDTLTFTANIRPICLPFDRENYDLQLKGALLAMWQHNADRTRVMVHRANLTVHPMVNCQDSDEYSGLELDEETQMCADPLDVCDDRSGVPLMDDRFFRNRFRFVQFGLVVSNSMCEPPIKMLTLAVRIAPYLDWILDVVGNEE